MNHRSPLRFFLGVLLLGLTLEAASYCSFSILERKPFSFSAVHAEQEKRASSVPPSNEQALFELPTVMHPYLGYVTNPDEWVKNATHMGYGVSSYGFFDKHSPVLRRKHNRVVIGIFGGSVAWWFSSLGEDAFRAALAESPRFRGKKIELVRVALSAYKQPQQLLALSYLLSLGAHFDYVVSLDGFNEIALPASGNLAKSINPFFPHYWQEIFQRAGAAEPEPEALRAKMYEVWRREWAGTFRSGWKRWTVSGNLVWLLVDRSLANRIERVRTELAEKTKSKAGGVPYAVRGPAFDPARPKLYRSFARVWERGALTMAKICSSLGIRYIHFLQPNQYVPDSKPFSKEELVRAYAPDIFWRSEVLKGYPELIAAGERLRDEGVDFHDLTGIFRDHPETLYEDNCCHLSAAGNAVLARAIAHEVIEAAER